MICPVCWDDVFREDLDVHLVEYHKMPLTTAIKLAKIAIQMEESSSTNKSVETRKI